MRYLLAPWRAGVGWGGAGDVQGAGAAAGGGGASDPDGETPAMCSHAPYVKDFHSSSVSSVQKRVFFHSILSLCSGTLSMKNLGAELKKEVACGCVPAGLNSCMTITLKN